MKRISFQSGLTELLKTSFPVEFNSAANLVLCNLTNCMKLFIHFERPFGVPIDISPNTLILLLFMAHGAFRVQTAKYRINGIE